MIPHIYYNGTIQLTPDFPRQAIPTDQESPSPGSLSDNNVYVSNKQLVRFKSKEYLLFLDGIIYEFYQQPFSDDQYPLLAGRLSADYSNTLRALNGEFTLVFADHFKNMCRIIASESGNASLFYRRHSNQLSFSNSLSMMHGRPEGRDHIDFQRIHDLITGNNLGSERTCFSSVKRLLPGYCIKADRGTVTVENYSEIFTGQPQRNAMDDPYGRFYSLFQESVRRRLKGSPVGIALSSGKDSTSVAAMAVRSRDTNSQVLKGYTFIPGYLTGKDSDNPQYNEGIILKSLLDMYPDLESRQITPGTGTLLESLGKSLDIYGEPVFGVSNQFWIQEMHRMMKDDQCARLITGQGGNYTISWPPPGLVSGKGKYSNSFLSVVSKKLKRKQKVIPYVTAEFLHKVDSDHFLEKLDRRNMGAMQLILLKNSIAYTGYLQKQVSLHHGIHVSDPTVDKEIIEFCLSLPFSIYHDRKSSRKLVTEGLKDILPGTVLSNPARGLQASDIQSRIEFEKGKFQEMIEFLNKNKLVTFVLETGDLARDWKYLDISKLSRTELNHLLRIILVGIFLSRI